jgi:hypothetical protein
VATIVARRRATPLFGLGLVDAVPDATFLALPRKQARRQPEVAGHANIVTDVVTGGTAVGKFGWKRFVSPTPSGGMPGPSAKNQPSPRASAASVRRAERCMRTSSERAVAGCAANVGVPVRGSGLGRPAGLGPI